MDRAQWNFASIIAACVVFSVNGIAGYAMLTGHMTVDQWLGSTGVVNGYALRWVGTVLGEAK